MNGTIQCVTSGVIEFTNSKHVVLENEGNITVYLRRSYGSSGIVSVDYKYNVNNTEIIETKVSST